MTTSPGAGDGPVVELRQVSFSYAGPPVLSGVQLAIADREFVCVVGPNGGGKTTLLKLILGLEKPSQGEVRVLGGAPEDQRIHIGYVPQSMRFDPQFPVTVIDIALMGRLGLSRGLRYSRADRLKALEALDAMGIADQANRPFADLSGGQRQRTLIARALAGEPRLLLLDEPTANIDAAAETLLMSVIRSLAQRMTVLMVSHDLGFVSSHVDRVVCVNRQVVIHPTIGVTEAHIRNLYGGEIMMVRHDHICAEGQSPDA